MKTPCLVFALVASVTTAFAVDPPPDGGYPNQNTAEGDNALFSLTTGSANTAVGDSALFSLTDGTQNTAIGFEAMYSSAEGVENTAIGHMALYANTTGGANVAVGTSALYDNTTGQFNVAIGDGALTNSITGNANVAIGWGALTRSTASVSTGASNTAVGFGAMNFSTTGAFNVSVGDDTMSFNSAGSYNVAMGHGAMNMSSGSYNLALGQSAGVNLAGSYNIALGQSAALNVTTGSNNIEIGSQGAKNDSGVIRIGTSGTQTKTFIAGISGVTASNGAAVVINSKGQLGTITSSARYKDNIQPMAKSSEAVLSLKPVTFRYKKELDPDAIPQFGLVAEDVAKVDPELVARDEQGKPYTVRYEAVNAMLLNEFLKEHQKVEEQGKEIAELKAAMKELRAAQTHNQ